MGTENKKKRVRRISTPVKKSFLSESLPTPFEKQSLNEMKKDLKKTLKFLKKEENLDEEEGKELFDEVFEESLKRKLSFIDSFSRIDSSVF